MTRLSGEAQGCGRPAGAWEAAWVLPSPVEEVLGPACTPSTRARVGALGLEEVGVAAQSPLCTPALPGPLAVLSPQALGVVPSYVQSPSRTHGVQVVLLTVHEQW